MPAASTASGSPAFGPIGAPAVRDITHNATEPALPKIPAARTSLVGYDHARYPQISWNTAIEAKKTPDGTQSVQCIGITAKWITAAPIEATAAHRAASRLSVFVVCWDTTHRH